MIQKILALLQNSIAFIVVTLLVTILLTYIFRKSYLRYVVLVIVGEGILAYVVGVSKALFGTTFLIFNTLVLLGYVLFVLRWLGRKLKRPMDQMARRMERLASGNLVLERDESSTRRRDEFGTLNRNFFAMVELMSSPVRNAVAASSSVVEASEQFKVQAGAIAQGASSQAASAEEISSAIEEMAANISQNLDNTKTGAVIGGQVNERLGSVSKAFEETEVSMQHIQARITAIGDIANKTNILAINAAIEAARAGELGKGFAVVAGEVRRLADQSAKLAEEIQRMSNQSANAVDTMGATLRETIPSIQKIVGIVQEIAAASGEQKSGTEQISAALATLAHVTNENASTSNALNESADRLVALSEDLQGSMKVFVIE